MEHRGAVRHETLLAAADEKLEWDGSVLEAVCCMAFLHSPLLESGCPCPGQVDVVIDLAMVRRQRHIVPLYKSRLVRARFMSHIRP